MERNEEKDFIHLILVLDFTGSRYETWCMKLLIDAKCGTIEDGTACKF